MFSFNTEYKKSKKVENIYQVNMGSIDSELYYSCKLDNYGRIEAKNINCGYVYNTGNIKSGSYESDTLDNKGNIDVINFSCFDIKNTGKIDTSVYKSEKTSNDGDIVCSSFNCLELINKGNLKVRNYKCDVATNHGVIIVKQTGKVNFGSLKIVEDGILDFNDVIFAAKSQLRPEFKEYLERSGKGVITSDGSSITLNGIFELDLKDAKLNLPQFFGKYTQEPSWFFKPNRVSSVSKRTGESKYWKSKQVEQGYPLTEAISSVFKHRLLHIVLGAPKAKFDSFANLPTVLFREESASNPESVKFKHVLQKHIIEEIVSKKREDLLKSLDEMSQGIGKYNDANNQYWFVQKISSFFYGSNNNPLDIINKEINNENFIENLTEVANLLSENDFERCSKVKDAICKNVTENGSKFTKEQIDDEIIPQIDEAVSQIKENISFIKDYANNYCSNENLANLKLK